MVSCGVVWCGVVWCIVVWCGGVWCRVCLLCTSDAADEEGSVGLGWVRVSKTQNCNKKTCWFHLWNASHKATTLHTKSRGQSRPRVTTKAQAKCSARGFTSQRAARDGAPSHYSLCPLGAGSCTSTSALSLAPLRAPSSNHLTLPSATLSAATFLGSHS